MAIVGFKGLISSWWSSNQAVNRLTPSAVQSIIDMRRTPAAAAFYTNIITPIGQSKAEQKMDASNNQKAMHTRVHCAVQLLHSTNVVLINQTVLPIPVKIVLYSNNYKFITPMSRDGNSPPQQ